MSNILEAPSEEECYLYAILTDLSGLDLAEFLYVDHEQPDDCFRAWCYQWKMFRCNDPKQISCSARSVGKSMSAKFRAMAFPFNYPGQEMVITAPEGVHLDALTDVIETAFDSSILLRSMVKADRGGVKHRPFMANFNNGARIMGRIPQRSGSGVKGCVVQASLVLTRRGRIHPDEITVQDEVLSRSGHWQRVLDLQSFEDDCYEVVAENGSLVANGPHPILCCTRRDDGTFSPWNWERVETIDPGNNLHWARTGPYGPASHLAYHDGFWPEKIISVKACGRQTVYNIVTGDHTYIADHVVCHNTHPVVLIQDEASDYPHAGWMELIETLKTASEDSMWIAHGVTRGFRDDFYKFTQPDSGFTVHRITAIHRPNWTDEERQQKIEMYGSKDSPDYRRNILGKHGDSTSSLFVLSRLMQCVSTEGSPHTTEEYQLIHVNGEEVSENNDDILQLVDLPISHSKYHEKYPVWIGADIGFCVDEDTEIFTQRGWLKWHEVRGGEDRTLTFNPKTKQSEWGNIYVTYAGRTSKPMIHMKGQSFDSLTTPNHRWPTLNEAGNFTWKTTGTLDGESWLIIVDGSNIHMESYAEISSLEEIYDGVVWCPSTDNQNWLAKRDGSVYFTGNTVDPTEILTFVELPSSTKSKPDDTILKLVSRFKLERVQHRSQVEIMLWLIGFYKPNAYCMDRTGLGLPLFQDIQERSRSNPALAPVLDVIKGYNFSEKITVAIDDSVEVDQFFGDIEKEAGLKRNVLEESTDVLRGLVDAKRLLLPFDKDVIGEFQGQTFTYSKVTSDLYGRRRIFSKHGGHSLDASRMAVLGWSQSKLEMMLDNTKKEDIQTVFLY